MNPHQHAATYLFMNALVALNKTMEVRTRVLSKRNLASLLNERPAAITLSCAGVLEVDRLLDTCLEHDALFRAVADLEVVERWRCYLQKPGDQQFVLKELMDEDALHRKVADLERRAAATKSANMPVCVLIPDIFSTPARDEQITSVLTELLARSGAESLCIVDEADSAAARRSGDEVSDRDALRRIRKGMLDAVGSFTSEELAAAANSITSNASQFAADQRKAGKLFGVRFGAAWHYPKFQFDSMRNTIPEMKDVLTALSPDEQGWDRLQWFLEPHEKLKGRTPLEVWKTNRKKVVEAANAERWNGRD